MSVARYHSVPECASSSSFQMLWNEMCRPQSDIHNREYTPKTNAKVDRYGNYLPFPNITIVCHVKLNDSLKDLPRQLDELAGEYINPLPAESYHATICTGPTRVAASKKGSVLPPWYDILNDSSGCWQSMATYLNNIEYTLSSNLVISHMKKTNGVTVYLAPSEHVQQNEINMAASNSCSSLSKNKNNNDTTSSSKSKPNRPQPFVGDETTKQIRSDLRLMAPRNGMMEERERPIHVTLAYARPMAGSMPNEIQEQVVKVVHNAFYNYASEPVEFLPARLCLSPDMTRFIPWDGTSP